MFIACTFAQYSVSRFAGYKNNLFPANHNLGRSEWYRSSARFTTRLLLSIAHLHGIHVTWLNWIFTTSFSSVFNDRSPQQTRAPPRRTLVSQSFQRSPYRENAFSDTCICCLDCFYGSQGFFIYHHEKDIIIYDYFSYLALYRLIQCFIDYTGIKHGSSLNH